MKPIMYFYTNLYKSIAYRIIVYESYVSIYIYIYIFTVVYLHVCIWFTGSLFTGLAAASSSGAPVLEPIRHRSSSAEDPILSASTGDCAALSPKTSVSARPGHLRFLLNDGCLKVWIVLIMKHMDGSLSNVFTTKGSVFNMA